MTDFENRLTPVVVRMMINEVNRQPCWVYCFLYRSKGNVSLCDFCELNFTTTGADWKAYHCTAGYFLDVIK